MPLRFVLALSKAEQLGLFGPTKLTQVAGHQRVTHSGTVATVAPHQRHVKQAEPEPNAERPPYATSDAQREYEAQLHSPHPDDEPGGTSRAVVGTYDPNGHRDFKMKDVKFGPRRREGRAAQRDMYRMRAEVERNGGSPLHHVASVAPSSGRTPVDAATDRADQAVRQRKYLAGHTSLAGIVDTVETRTGEPVTPGRFRAELAKRFPGAKFTMRRSGRDDDYEAVVENLPGGEGWRFIGGKAATSADAFRGFVDYSRKVAQRAPAWRYAHPGETPGAIVEITRLEVA